MEIKICKTCSVEKELILFPREIRKGDWYYLPSCKVCTNLRKKDAATRIRHGNK